MHETGILLGIARIAERTARENGADEVIRVVLQVGAHSGAVPHFLCRCWPAVTQDTPLAGAQLVIEDCACDRDIVIKEIEVR